MNLDNSTLILTGAPCGMGLVFARAALARSAREANAGARDDVRLTLHGVTPIRLDEEVIRNVKFGLWAQPGVFPQALE